MIEKKNFLSLLSPAASSLSLSQKKKNRSGENQFLHFFFLISEWGGGCGGKAHSQGQVGWVQRELFGWRGWRRYNLLLSFFPLCYNGRRRRAAGWSGAASVQENREPKRKGGIKEKHRYFGNSDK